MAPRARSSVVFPDTVLSIVVSEWEKVSLGIDRFAREAAEPRRGIALDAIVNRPFLPTASLAVM